ncbi:MAG: CoA pyrophosphatase [bacterium]
MADDEIPFDTELRRRVVENLARHNRVTVALGDRRPAAVAILLVADEAGRSAFVLTRRASKLADHPGQFALPGGRIEAGESAVEAALRETTEEVGLRLPAESVLGVLDDYVTRSGFVITPIVAWGGASPQLVADPAEVARIFRVPLADLEHPAIPELRTIPESERPVISLPLVDTHIHAPTASVLFQMREVAIHGRTMRVDGYEEPVWAWR